jgi:DNA-binding PadR family transcriptional regulator
VPESAEIHLSPAEWASLALLSERPAHGFAIARALARDGEVGRVWASSRPLVYRALTVLTERGLVEERGSEASASGPPRTVLGVTRAGRRAVQGWLAAPAAHVRDLRADLMLKLLFLSRRGADASGLLARQREVLVPVVEGLASAAESAVGFERVLYLWRLESARAALRFVDEISSEARAALPSP